MKNRYKDQNVDLLYQIIEHCETNSIPGIVLAVDYEKAFDKLSWKFIEEVLAKLNFGEMLIKWVKLFYKNVSGVVNVNGWFTKPFAIQKGVKQGDPLSSYLFILCVEILAENMRKNCCIKGIQLGPTEHKLSMFADDTNIFLDCCAYSLETLLSYVGRDRQWDK